VKGVGRGVKKPRGKKQVTPSQSSSASGRQRVLMKTKTNETVRRSGRVAKKLWIQKRYAARKDGESSTSTLERGARKPQQLTGETS